MPKRKTKKSKFRTRTTKSSKKIDRKSRHKQEQHNRKIHVLNAKYSTGNTDKKTILEKIKKLILRGEENRQFSMNSYKVEMQERCNEINRQKSIGGSESQNKLHVEQIKLMEFLHGMNQAMNKIHTMEMSLLTTALKEHNDGELLQMKRYLTHSASVKFMTLSKHLEDSKIGESQLQEMNAYLADSDTDKASVLLPEFIRLGSKIGSIKEYRISPSPTKRKTHGVADPVYAETVEDNKEPEELGDTGPWSVTKTDVFGSGAPTITNLEKYLKKSGFKVSHGSSHDRYTLYGKLVTVSRSSSKNEIQSGMVHGFIKQINIALKEKYIREHGS